MNILRLFYNFFVDNMFKSYHNRINKKCYDKSPDYRQ